MSKIKPRTDDHLEMEVPLQINSSKGALWILVILPAKYPYQAPLIQVAKAKVVHRYLDANMRVIHPSLNDWTQKSNLLSAIKQIHDSFNSDPPKLAQKASETEERKGYFIQKPDLSAVLKDVQNFEVDELKTLNDDEDFFFDYFNNLDGVKELGANFSKILEGLKTQASENIEEKKKVDNEINQYECLYSEYEHVSEEYAKLKEQEQEIKNNLSKENILKALKDKRARFEKIQAEIQEAYNSESISLDAYIHRFKENRKEIAKYNIIISKVQ